MSSPRNGKREQVLEVEVLPATPYPLAIPAKPPRLANLRDVRREMAKVYGDMRLGRLDTSDGAKLIYALTSIGKVIEVAEIETRLSALESINER